MSAELLRRAAAVLREHGKAATPGPWGHVDHGPPTGSFRGCGQVITEDADLLGGDIAGPTGDLYPRSGYSPRDDMALIALLGPPVALALADLLACISMMPSASDPTDRSVAEALARAILRGGA